MQYRTHRKTGDRISEIGFGSSYIPEVGEATGIEALSAAYAGGVNYFDLAAADARCFPYYGKAFSSVRENIRYQIHFGACYDRGAYGWSTDPDRIKRNVERILTALKTDYIDYGFIHCLDERSDWEQYQRSGSLAYLLQLKEQGVVKHIGLSSHTPELIQTVLDEVSVDTLMFSVNPAYDYHRGAYASGSTDERTAVYRRCESEGIGITVMKPFSGGQLLDAKLSPFGRALTPYQCIRYALDRPGVLCVLPGMTTKKQVEDLLRYYELSEEETDYSAIASFSPADAVGKCVYCNHCQPCPQGIDVGLVNKYYDLAKIGDDMAVQHYRGLDHHAEECIACGHCNVRCPFSVDQEKRMKEIAEHFETCGRK